MGWITGHGLRRIYQSEAAKLPADQIAIPLREGPDFQRMKLDALQRQSIIAGHASSPSYAQLIQFIEAPNAYRPRERDE